MEFWNTECFGFQTTYSKKKVSDMTDWPPSKKWWMDVLKFCITFILGALLTVTAINNCEDQRAKQQFRWKKQHESNLRIYEDFKKARSLSDYYLFSTTAYIYLI